MSDERPKCEMVAPPAAQKDNEPDDLPVFGRQEITDVEDIKIEKLPVPEWECSVFLRVMSGRERDQFEASISQRPGNVNLVDFRARFACMVLCNEDGEKLFGPADVGMLTTKSSAALDRIFEAGRRLNRMSQEDVEDLVKNSERDLNADSGSA